MEIISFYKVQATYELKNRRKLKEFIKKVFRLENRSLINLKIIFCNDSYLEILNKKFLRHNTLTDIITFNLSSSPQIIEGELYMSIERIKENSLFFKNSLRQEIHRVIFHGILHLCGYNDKTRRDINKMREKENEYLTLYKEFHVKQI